jgi:hypothetical protein
MPSKRATHRAIFPFSTDDRRLIARVRERLRWIDSLPELQRTGVIYGLSESDAAVYGTWIAETVAAIAGTSRRVWHPELGYWRTEKTP